MKLKSIIWLMLFTFFGSLQFSCTPNTTSSKTKEKNEEKPPSLIAQIEATNKDLLNANNIINIQNAHKYVSLITEFAKSSNDTALVIKYAHQGGEVAKNINQFTKATALYDLLASRFSNKPNAVANALFAKAYVLENNLHKLEEAKKIYESILENLPDTDISKSIPSVLSAMGKSEADLLKMIKKQNH